MFPKKERFQTELINYPLSIDHESEVGNRFQQCLKILGFMVKLAMISIYSRHEET
ncbi:MAG: hypothetical protein AB4063_15170 [Crocosphaera sp.]